MLPFDLWNQFRIKLCEREVFVWSDGGTKSYNTLGSFAALREQWRCLIHPCFFAPHHGHSVVDGHFGVGKKLIGRRFPPPNLIRTTEDILHCWKELKATTVQFLPIINAPLEHGQPKDMQPCSPLAKQGIGQPSAVSTN